MFLGIGVGKSFSYRRKRFTLLINVNKLLVRTKLVNLFIIFSIMAVSKSFSIQLIEPKIIKLAVVEGIELEQKDAKEMITEAVELAQGGEYAILFDANKSGNISFEAREEFAKSKKRKAVAIVTNSLANKLLGNFFINFHKPLSSSRIFSEEQSAIEWLRTQMAQQ